MTKETSVATSWIYTVAKMAAENKKVLFANKNNIEEISTRKSGWGYVKIAVPNDVAQELLSGDDLNGGLLLFSTEEFEQTKYEIEVAVGRVELIKKEQILGALEEIQSSTYMSTCMSKDECSGKREMLSRVIEMVKNMPVMCEMKKERR